MRIWGKIIDGGGMYNELIVSFSIASHPMADYNDYCNKNNDRFASVKDYICGKRPFPTKKGLLMITISKPS
jgi:hypothetical protein